MGQKGTVGISTDQFRVLPTGLLKHLGCNFLGDKAKLHHSQITLLKDRHPWFFSSDTTLWCPLQALTEHSTSLQLQKAPALFFYRKTWKKKFISWKPKTGNWSGSPQAVTAACTPYVCPKQPKWQSWNWLSEPTTCVLTAHKRCKTSSFKNKTLQFNVTSESPEASVFSPKTFRKTKEISC